MANMYMNGQTSLHLGADVAMNFTEREPMHAIFDKTVGRGVDVASTRSERQRRSRAACA
jgi:hypothetical protein